MSEEEIDQDARAVREFETMIMRNQQEAISDLESDDVNSLNILIKLAEPHANTDEEHRAVRHIKKRVQQL